MLRSAPNKNNANRRVRSCGRTADEIQMPMNRLGAISYGPSVSLAGTLIQEEIGYGSQIHIPWTHYLCALWHMLSNISFQNHWCERARSLHFIELCGWQISTSYTIPTATMVDDNQQQTAQEKKCAWTCTNYETYSQTSETKIYIRIKYTTKTTTHIALLRDQYDSQLSQQIKRRHNNNNISASVKAENDSKQFRMPFAESNSKQINYARPIINRIFSGAYIWM